LTRERKLALMSLIVSACGFILASATMGWTEVIVNAGSWLPVPDASFVLDDNIVRMEKCIAGLASSMQRSRF
jgi:hypothetical protein